MLMPRRDSFTFVAVFLFLLACASTARAHCWIPSSFPEIGYYAPTHLFVFAPTYEPTKTKITVLIPPGGCENIVPGSQVLIPSQHSMLKADLLQVTTVLMKYEWEALDPPPNLLCTPRWGLCMTFRVLEWNLGCVEQCYTVNYWFVPPEGV